MVAVAVQRSRQDRAFERLYRRHVADVHRYALALLSNPADAEDVTQTAFLNAYRAFQRGERPERPLNWLIAITHNVCRQRFRRAARRPSEVALDYDVPEEVVGDDEVPRAEEIQRALAQLAFNQRSALVMRELEGRSYAEIAAVLGTSQGAVEAMLFRARRALREQLEGSLGCSEVEQAISRQLDGELARAERGALRGHLRACPECARLARRMRATRTGLRSLAAVPLPGSLASFFGGGATTVGTGTGLFSGGLVLKAAVLVGASAALVAGGAADRAPMTAASAATSQTLSARTPHRSLPASVGRATSGSVRLRLRADAQRAGMRTSIARRGSTNTPAADSHEPTVVRAAGEKHPLSVQRPAWSARSAHAVRRRTRSAASSNGRRPVQASPSRASGTTASKPCSSGTVRELQSKACQQAPAPTHSPRPPARNGAPTSLQTRSSAVTTATTASTATTT